MAIFASIRTRGGKCWGYKTLSPTAHNVCDAIRRPILAGGEVGRFLIRRPYVHPVDVDIALGIDRYDFAVRVGFEDDRPVASIEKSP
jgi:hypothetical protein